MDKCDGCGKYGFEVPLRDAGGEDAPLFCPECGVYEPTAAEQNAVTDDYDPPAVILDVALGTIRESAKIAEGALRMIAPPTEDD